MQRERLPLAGLSPLARGTLPLYMPECRCYRFIPAGAGNTPFGGTSRDHWPVYPRWRGEHLVMVETNGPGSGLSPLARGTPISVSRRICDCRFIPAGAGNTPLRFCRVSVISVYPRWRGEHSKHNLLLINDFLSQSQSTNFIVSYKQHIHYVKEHLIH